MSGRFGTAQAWFAVTGQQVSQPSSGLSRDSSDFLRWPLVSVLELGPSGAASAHARRHVMDVLVSWEIARDLIPDAELITAELMSNAIRATLGLNEPQPVGLRLLGNQQRLVVEVWDANPDDPVRRAASDFDAESGRGLQIVEALSNRWGCRRLSTYVKAVWAELLMPQARM